MRKLDRKDETMKDNKLMSDWYIIKTISNVELEIVDIIKSAYPEDKDIMVKKLEEAHRAYTLKLNIQSAMEFAYIANMATKIKEQGMIKFDLTDPEEIKEYERIKDKFKVIKEFAYFEWELLKYTRAIQAGESDEDKEEYNGELVSKRLLSVKRELISYANHIADNLSFEIMMNPPTIEDFGH